MSKAALLSALGLWAREPRALLLVNLLFAALLALALLAAALLSAPVSWALGLLLATALFLGLIRVLRGLDQGRLPGWQLWGRQFLGSLVSSLPSGLLALAALGLAAAAFQGAPLGPLLVALALWLGLGALLSLGLAAPSGQAWWAAAWAGLLAAVAFLPSALLAALLLSWLGGFWALWLGARHWGAGLCWAPLLLAPFFTPSFYAAYLYYLAQGIKDRSQGRPPLEGAPTLKEILKPWR
jgi:hypothetical protein